MSQIPDPELYLYSPEQAKQIKKDSMTTPNTHPGDEKAEDELIKILCAAINYKTGEYAKTVGELSLDEALTAVQAYTEQKVREARVDELNGLLDLIESNNSAAPILVGLGDILRIRVNLLDSLIHPFVPRTSVEQPEQEKK